MEGLIIIPWHCNIASCTFGNLNTLLNLLVRLFRGLSGCSSFLFFEMNLEAQELLE